MFGLTGNKQLPTVLLIDDDMVSREVMATVLTMGGYEMHTAEDGMAALEMLENAAFAPEVILMDAQMPGLSGSRLIAHLRERSHATVIAISASSAPDEVTSAADGFLLKPFGSSELGKMLDERNAHAAPPEPDLDPDEPVVSRETLAQLRGMMPETGVRQIYAAIVADLSKRAAALQSAVAKGDTDEVRRIGHAIKGGCGMAGALQAARLGARIEALGAAATAGHGGDDLDNSARLLSDLRNAARSLERMLEAEFPA
jgi:CheY-like chemotaxis protein